MNLESQILGLMDRIKFLVVWDPGAMHVLSCFLFKIISSSVIAEKMNKRKLQKAYMCFRRSYLSQILTWHHLQMLQTSQV